MHKEILTEEQVKLLPLIENFTKDFGLVGGTDLLTLAALKAFALGRRAKWKDYVDLYFIMEKSYGIDKIIKKSTEIFGNEFNEKIFRAQLAYFKDIDYTEEVIYMKGYEVDDKVIKKGLLEFALA